MQKDFHHGTIYALARIAGFEKKNAEKLAYASQYVDDATHGGLIEFANGAVFKRSFSAHKALDIRNIDLSDNLDIWLPFHFLPGNGNNPKGDTTGITRFIQRLIALPNSPIAQEMINETINQAHKPNGLHRFGVALHVYADTWAHQGFAGIIHDINDIEDPKELSSPEEEEDWWDRLKEKANDIMDDVAPPIGHGRASFFPDLPYISWSYDRQSIRNKRERETITRNNCEIFVDAAKNIFEVMTRYLKATNPGQKINSLGEHNLNQIERLFKNTKDECGDSRHKSWLRAIREGKFTIDGIPLKDNINYDSTDENSWKYQAIGTMYEPHPPYREDFLTSDWKYFHDAVLAHRFYVLHELLPTYGICAG